MRWRLTRNRSPSKSVNMGYNASGVNPFAVGLVESLKQQLQIVGGERDMWRRKYYFGKVESEMAAPRQTTFEGQTLQEFQQSMRGIFTGMEELLTQKRKSYGSGNLTRHGMTGIVVRMGDKIARLDNMVESNTYHNADGDAMEDALRDMIGYAALGLLYLSFQKGHAENATENATETTNVGVGVGSDIRIVERSVEDGLIWKGYTRGEPTSY